MIPRKLVEIEQLCSIITDLRTAGWRIVFTNGCFDVIHPGHILHLQQARQEGDVLVVALNSDKSIRRLKGSNRPIFNQQERGMVLNALESVDYIIIFDTLRVTNIIEAIQPAIYVKGGGYTAETLVSEEYEALERCGAQIIILPEIGGFSTTGVIERIHNVLGGGVNGFDCD